MENKNHDKKYNALIEEYKALRQEIMNRQNSRLLILGFTITAIGTILGLTLKESIALQETNYYVSALIIFALLIIIAVLNFTIEHTQQIEIIGAYIRKFIEKEVFGLCWETHWEQYRKSRCSHPEKSGLPLGTSKSLSMYYGLLTIAVYFTAAIIGIFRSWYVSILVLILALISLLLCSFSLYMRKTKGWEINWDILKEKEGHVQ